MDIESLGLRFRLHPQDNTCERRLLFTPQFFDPEERALLLPRVEPGFVFIDIGANAGAYALLVAARSGPTGRTLAIEANPVMFARLQENASRNASLVIDMIQCAVTDRTAPIMLHRHPDNLGGSTIKPNSATDQDMAVTVMGHPLADILNDCHIERVDAMKLDIEGAEDIVLNAFFLQASEQLWPKLILLEMSPHLWSIDVKKILLDKGYQVLRVMGGNTAFERRETCGADCFTSTVEQ